MAKTQTTPDLSSINLIGEGTELEGTMRASTDVRVNGRVLGDLTVEGKVIVADKGVIDGTLKAKSADVAGKLKGDLVVDDRLLLKSTADIEGNIRTSRLVVEEGAKFEGNCSMGRLDAARKAMMGDGSDTKQKPVIGQS
ncbi:MAG: polymer-forming cytoskeletal protein [Rhodothermales bacterium]|nr:polymer-forming cytoskeletal protein [Rhodothermales bacterium]MBO6778337.1 polymer-forming cytoskeletal protein [Rhodothermales bacterium]